MGSHVVYFWTVDQPLVSGIFGQSGLLIKMVMTCLPVNFPALGLEGALLRRKMTKGVSGPYFRTVSPGPPASQKLAAMFSPPHNSL